MGYVVGSLYAVGRSSQIKWYFYLMEPETDYRSKQWLHHHVYDIGVRLGETAGIVCGSSPQVSKTILYFLEGHLRSQLVDAVRAALEGKVSLLLTRGALPNTKSMAILPLCNLSDSEDVVRRRIDRIVEVVRARNTEDLFKAADAFEIQEGYFDSLLTDDGQLFLRRALEVIHFKIPLWFIEIDLNPFLERRLERRLERGYVPARTAG
jgi:hypothetical protein